MKSSFVGWCICMVGFLAVAGSAHTSEIHDAVKKRDHVAIRRLLGADASLVNAKGAGDIAPLHIAAALNAADLIGILVEGGAALDQRTDTGATPLHWAAMQNSDKAAIALIAAGADTGALNAVGMTPLQVAESQKADLAAAVLRDAAVRSQVITAADPRVVRARKLLNSGSVQEAYDILSALFREDPTNEKLNYMLGLAAYGAKRYSHALLAFERVLAINPANGPARMALGRTYYATKQYELARDAFETVMEYDPPPHIRDKLNKLIEDSGQAARRYGSMLTARIGLVYDSNANVGPNSDVIGIAPITAGALVIDTLSIGDEFLPVETDGGFVAAGAAAYYDCGRRERWLLVGSVSGYRSWLTGDGSAHEVLFAGCSAGTRYAGRDILCQAPLRAEYIEYGGNELALVFGISPTLSWSSAPDARWQLVAGGSADYRDYHALDGRDGAYFSIATDIKRMLGNGNWRVAAGTTLSYDNASDRVYENTAIQGNAGVDLMLPWRSSLNLEFGYRVAAYKERETFAPDDREDAQFSFSAGLRTLVSAATGLELSFKRTENRSTYDLYEYDREMALLSVTHVF